MIYLTLGIKLPARRLQVPRGDSVKIAATKLSVKFEKQVSSFFSSFLVTDR